MWLVVKGAATMPEPQKYFVCYLDVLGQKDIMLSLERALQSDDDELIAKVNAVSILLCPLLRV